jgi:hypothetical protein
MDESASCPLCGEEKGSAQSVEQHISASTDGDHEGEHGPDYREEIEAGGAAGGDDRPTNGGAPSQDTDTAKDGAEREAAPSPSPSPAEAEEDGGGLLMVLAGLALLVVLVKGGSDAAGNGDLL